MRHCIIYPCSFYQWKSISFFGGLLKLITQPAFTYCFCQVSSLLTYHHTDLCRNPPPTLQQPELWSPEFNDFINKWVTTETTLVEYGTCVNVMCKISFVEMCCNYYSSLKGLFVNPVWFPSEAPYLKHDKAFQHPWHFLI